MEKSVGSGSPSPLDSALLGVDLSKTSTTKYNGVVAYVADLLHVDRAAIYATTVGKDFKVRFEQSDDARQRRIGIAVLKGLDYMEPSLQPARLKVEIGEKDLILLVGQRDGHWAVLQSIEKQGSGLSDKLAVSFPDMVRQTVLAHDIKSVGIAPPTPSQFSEDTFVLLQGLAAEPTLSYYSAHREEF